MKKELYIEELISGYFSGNLSTEESEELKEWINASSENKKQFQLMKEIWFSSISASDGRRFNKDEAWQRFLTHTGKTDETAGRNKNAWKILWQSAAAVAVLIVVSYFSFRQGSRQAGDRFADIRIETPYGSRVKTCLPDGTLVWLNAESNLTYSRSFGVNDRNVCLNGEAYFEVKRNEELPFNVQTKELYVNVLGTKFNFRNYSDDTEATVSLLEGKVELGNRIKEVENIIMKPGQKIFFNKKSGDMHTARVNANNIAQWTNGYLFFDEELLPNIAKELERNYDVKITIAHPDLEQLRYYGSFVKKELSIEEILDMLASTDKIKYSIKGKEIKLSPK